MGTRVLTSRRPYLLRAMREWLVDNGLTPYIAVDARMPGVSVPGEFVSEGHIILNIADEATHSLVIGNHTMEFSARFNGSQRYITLPVDAVLGIYAKETSQGMMFPEAEETAPAAADTPEPEAPRPGAHLTLVKKD